MRSNGTLSADWRLYVIVDRATVGQRDLRSVAEAAIRGGADVIQLRDKTASTAQRIEDGKRLLQLTRKAGIPLIFNDDVEACRAVGADGVHLGQDDMSVAAARRFLGRWPLIGKSTHSLEQATAAEAEEVAYIGVGPIFPTPTKPDYASVGLALIGEVARRIHTPFICIGGIDERNVDAVIQAGARCVAVVRAVCAADDPEAAARRLKAKLLSHSDRSSVSTSL